MADIVQDETETKKLLDFLKMHWEKELK